MKQGWLSPLESCDILILRSIGTDQVDAEPDPIPGWTVQAGLRPTTIERD